MNAEGTTPSHPRAITVVLIDRDDSVRENFLKVLLPHKDIFVHGMYSSVREAGQRTSASTPNLFVIGDSIPKEEALTFTRRILKRQPNVFFLYWRAEETTAAVIEAMRAGAIGYLPKSAQPDEIVASVRRAATGEPALPASVARALVKKFEEDSKKSQAEVDQFFSSPRNRKKYEEWLKNRPKDKE